MMYRQAVIDARGTCRRIWEAAGGGREDAKPEDYEAAARAMTGGLLATIGYCQRDYMPAQVVLAWEPKRGPVPTLDEDMLPGRYAIAKTYKAGRSTPAEYYEAEDEIQAFFTALDVVQAYPPTGWEADDVAATVAALWPPKTLLYSADKDWLQLVDHQVHLHRPIKRELVTPETIRDVRVGKTSGLDADGWLYYQALTGDSGDNVSGVKGIGPTRALALLDACPLLVEYVMAGTDDAAREQVAGSDPSMSPYLERCIARREALQQSFDLVRLRTVDLTLEQPDPSKVAATRAWLEALGVVEQAEGLWAIDSF